MKKFYFILAADKKNGIGKKGKLAWNIPEDMIFFKNITTKVEDEKKQNAVIMGKNTWLSLPEKFRPLPGRKNIILSNTLKNENIQNANVYQNFEKALKSLDTDTDIENIFVIGGAAIFNTLKNHKNLEKIFFTSIEADYKCDVFFDGIPNNFTEKKIIKKIDNGNIMMKISLYQKL